MKRFLFCFLVIAFAFSKVYAYDFEAVCPSGQTLYYNIIDANNHYVEVTRPSGGYNWQDYSQPTVSLVIPSNVTYGSIDYSVISIGERAFFQCSRITDIALNNAIQILGKLAFYGCTGLTSITIPSSVTTIHEGAFQGCTYLNTLYYNAINSSFIFTGSPPGVGSSTITPFYGCISFQTLILGPDVRNIPDYLFYNYPGVGGSPSHHITGPLVFPSTLQSIGNYTFHCCHDITGTLSIPSGVSYVGESAFYNCDGITAIDFNAINCQCPNYPFCLPYDSSSGPSSIMSINIGSNVLTIPDCFFGGLSGVTELNIPSSVTSIGQGAFSGCSGISSLYISDNVEFIGSGAFSNCPNLVSIELGTNISIIHNGGGFADLNLQNLVFNAINCHTNVTTNPMMFSNCTIDNIQIGNNVQRIPEGFLWGATVNSPIELPESLTIIGDNAFSWCQFVGTLTIPQLVTSIGDYAFSHMSGLSKVISLAVVPPTCGAWAFQYSYSSSNPPLEVPCGCINDYRNSSGWNRFQNISESTSCSHQIIVHVNPSNAGLIQGEGVYYYGSSCVLSATPNANYVFVNWTRNGNIITTSPSLSFTVTEDMALVANFSYYNTVNQLDDAISIYPNPSNNIVYIDVKNLKEIEIYDLRGMLVLTKKAIDNHNEIDVRQLPKGLYCIRLFTDDGFSNYSFVRN